MYLELCMIVPLHVIRDQLAIAIDPEHAGVLLR